MNNTPQIFRINTLEEERKLIEQVNHLLKQANYDEVIAECKRAIKLYSKNKSLYIYLSVAYLAAKQLSRSSKILTQANKIFPNDCQLQFELAKTEALLFNDKKAEKYFLSSLKHTPINNGTFKSDVNTVYGQFLWDTNRSVEAIERWNCALVENPNNKLASAKLKNYTVNSGSNSSSNKLIENFPLFQKIQTIKYFKSIKRKSFETKEEAEAVIGIITNCWNYQVAPNPKLDSLTGKKIENWFKSIEIDFSKLPTNKLLRKEKTGSVKKTKGAKKKSKAEMEFEKISSMLPFLPPQGIAILPFTLPAILTAGISESRFIEIINKGNYDDDEEEIILWAFDLTSTILISISSKIKKEMNKFKKEANNIALELLEPGIADMVISSIQQALQIEFLDSEIDSKNN